MIELVKYFRILFLSNKISFERLKDFCEDHIQRLTTNNPGGIFTTILTNVTNAYNAFFGDLSSKALNEAVKEGKTIALNASRRELEKNISENEGLISYTYRNNATAYEEFYPLGITEYLRASTSGLETISLRYKNVLGNHAADFPVDFVNAYNSRQQIYVDNRAAQQAAKGEVAAERSDLATTKPALCNQLTVNLLTIALQYVGDESKADTYFNQAILNAAFKESETKVSAIIAPGETHNVFSNITKPDVTLIGENTGDSFLFIGFKASPTEPATQDDRHLAPGQKQGGEAGEGGWTPEKKYMNVTNTSDITGSYIIQKV